MTGWSWVRIPLRQLRFGTLAIQFTPLCQRLSEETLQSIGPFYLVSMPEEVKDPASTHWKCVIVVYSKLEILKDQSMKPVDVKKLPTENITLYSTVDSP